MKQKRPKSIKFISKFFETGAIKETSRDTELEICRYIPRDCDVVVVEFGMGYGNITREILNTISPNSKLYAFEINAEFCAHVRKSIDDPRLVIVNDGAENLKKYVSEELDCVLSSIPFTFIAEQKVTGIIRDAHEMLKQNGWWCQVAFTKFNFKKLVRVFDKCEMIKLGNFPVEFIYHCQKTS